MTKWKRQMTGRHCQLFLFTDVRQLLKWRRSAAIAHLIARAAASWGLEVGAGKQRVSATGLTSGRHILSKGLGTEHLSFPTVGRGAAASLAGARGQFTLVIYWYPVLRSLPRLHWRDPRGSGFTRLTLQSASFLVQCVYLPRTIFGVCS